MKSQKITINGKLYTFLRGKIAKVYYSKNSPCGIEKPIRFCRKIASRIKTSWHPLGDLEKLNLQIREIEKSADLHGLRFAIPTNEEVNAIRAYRQFAHECRKHDQEFPTIFELISTAISRESEARSAAKISELIESYIEEKRTIRNTTEHYLNSQQRILTRFAQFVGDKPIAQIKIPDAQAFVTNPEFAQNSRKCYAIAIKTFFTWHFKRINSTRSITEQIRNPLETFEIPRPKKTEEPKILKPEQLQKILTAARKYDLGILPSFVLQAFCGIRNAETTRLKWSDIRNGFVFLSRKITKTQTARVAPIPECASLWIDLIKSQKPDAYIVCPKITENRESAIYARQDTFRRTEKLTIPKNALRHSCATFLSAKFGNSRAADICGHSINVASEYYRAMATPQTAEAYFNIFPE